MDKSLYAHFARDTSNSTSAVLVSVIVGVVTETEQATAFPANDRNLPCFDETTNQIDNDITILDDLSNRLVIFQIEWLKSNISNSQ
jgi:hypothetical protein